MRDLKLTESFVPISEFKAKAADMLKRVQNGEDIVVTQHGKPAGVLISAADYQIIEYYLYVRRHIEAGLADIKAGRVIPHDEVVRQLEERFGKFTK